MPGTPALKLLFRGDVLAARRRALGLVQDEVARRVGVSRQRVTEWEQGATAPHPHRLRTLAEAVGLAPGQLVDRTSLRGRRYAAGLTQTDAAAAVGISAGRWGSWERGEAIPHHHLTTVDTVVGPPPGDA